MESANSSTPSGNPIPFAGRERRHDNRRPVQNNARITVLDGPETGAIFETTTRDLSQSGMSFLLRQPLSVGQNCRVDISGPTGNTSEVYEIVRSRPLSNGKFEMAVAMSNKPVSQVINRRFRSIRVA
jgi:hypothetical protein